MTGKTISASWLRREYFKFFQEKAHQLIPSASLVPADDPTVLFTTAGMHPLVPFLMGRQHPAGRRLVNVQKCIRTQDIDEVGDAWHCTFFEMLGNWSLGDYFKREAIQWSYEFLTRVLEIPLEKLAVSVFAGDAEVPADEESVGHWRTMGMPAERIFRLPRKNNFWGPAGQTGPCGPDTEMFYIKLDKCGFGRADCSPACDCGRYVEIWNDVFMEFEKLSDGTFRPLKQKNVDTGMGLLRVISVMNGLSSVYEAETYKPTMDFLRSISPAMDEKKRRIMADHIQTALFAIGDGVNPSNVQAGYVVRRILRRVYRIANQAALTPAQYLGQVVDLLVAQYTDQFPELVAKKDAILAVMREEEEKFSKALGQGLKALEKELTHMAAQGSSVISGKVAFSMFETFGFPVEVTEEIARERGVSVDIKGYDAAYAEHQEKSRMAGEKLFKGGLADHSEMTTKLHTATHLLHAALRQVLGTHVEQRGSNITPERLRFDFSHPDKMSKEQIEQVEGIVNAQIKRGLAVSMKELTLDEAKAEGAIGLFEDRYGAKVHVYTMGDFSKEVCGGPHVQNTGDLGSFKIQKEEASSRGVRRIKAVVAG